MRWLLVCVVVAGCGSSNGGSAPPPDAADGGLPPDYEACEGNPGDKPLCGTSCGNGVVDTCYSVVTETSHCHYYIPQTEVCDDAVTPSQSCTGIGYYGGSIVCSQCAYTDDCDPCPSNTSGCKTKPVAKVTGLSVSGSFVAQPDTQGVTIYDTGLVARAVGPGAGASLTAITGGWLVDALDGVHTLGYDGTLGAAQQAVPSGIPSTLAVGAGGVFRISYDMGVREGAVLDATGKNLIGPFRIMASAGANVHVATDDTHALVGDNGQLAFVAADGTVTIGPGVFRTGANVIITRATSSWYIVGDSNGWIAQRFAADGSLVGAEVAIGGQATAFLATATISSPRSPPPP